MSMIFILGADDPEMSAIEQLLNSNSIAYRYALGADGQRVTPATAYAAVGASGDDLNVDNIAFVECEVAGITPIARCDHHRPGDFGYGRPPADYWEASSVGQVAALLDNNNGWDIANSYGVEILMVAAADHCLAAAYAGQCYGVNPQELAEFRIYQRAKFQKRDVAELHADMERALRQLEYAPRVFLSDTNGCWDNGSGWCETHGQTADRCGAIADLRGTFVPELREAALIARLPGYLASVTEPGGRQKVVISADESNVRAFMGGWAAQNGLTEIYGNPVRGYAGGYVL